MHTEYRVRAAWDADAGVWIASSDDIQGLCCEAGTLEELIDIVLALAPELLQENGQAQIKPGDDIPIAVLAERHAVAKVV